MSNILEPKIENLYLFLQEKGWQIFSRTEIEHGIQIVVTNGIERIPVNFYTTGTINVQGKKSDMQSALKEWANLLRSGLTSIHQTATTPPLNRSAKFLVLPDKIEEIRRLTEGALPGDVVEKDAAGTAEIYRREVRRGAERVTLTQYHLGTLLVQGLHSALFDDVCETLDQFLTQSFDDRARRFLPGEDIRKAATPYLESGEAENDAVDWLLAQIENNTQVLDFMYENDRLHLLAASGVRNAIQNTNASLPDFSAIVMPFGKPLEGFIIKLAAHLGLAEEAELRKKASTIEIGNWLETIHRRLPDIKRYGEVADTLKAAWQCRNKAMHSDFVYPNTISSFTLAEQEILTILRAINRSYRVFVVDGVKLTIESPATRSQSPVDSEYKFEGVDRNRLLSELQNEKMAVVIQGNDKNNVWEIVTSDLKVFAPRSKDGMVIVKGEKAQEFCSHYNEILTSIPPQVTTWIGVDESGKGDVFGPLVIAGVAITPELEILLAKNGVRDSKDLSDYQIMELALLIKQKCAHEIIVLMPEKYNEVYLKFKNLNYLLAWGHAQAITSLQNSTGATRAISDQFGDEKLVLDALEKEKCKINLEQHPRAEDDMAVAAASILARASFIEQISALSKTAGIQLPLGSSSPQVQETAKTILRRKGANGLKLFSKIHFKTVAEIIPEGKL